MESGGLLERERDLARLRGLVDDAAGGRFRMGLVEGAAGSGKSVLLSALGVHAEYRGSRVLRACGLELERACPFGVVRQLFEPAVAELEPSVRGEVFAGAAALAKPLLGGNAGLLLGNVMPDGGFSLLHGVYWVLVGLCELGPVLLVVDDLQWCDAPSLRFLAFALKRADELPLLVAVARREAVDEASDPLFPATGRDASVIRPAPLSADAIGTVLEEAVGFRLDEDVVAEAQRLTEGNPLYLRELAETLRDGAGDGDEEPMARLQRAAPAAIDHRVRRALAALDMTARAVARAAAVLGDEVPLRHAAAVAGAEPQDAVRAADVLARARIFAVGEPLRFRHPLVREGVLESLEPRARAAAHARAASVLIADREYQQAAVHLLASDPAGDPVAVATLRAAAAEALAESAPEVAADLLRRALREPPVPAERPLVLKELALVEARIGDPGALGHFEEAFATTSSLADMADAAGRYATLLCGRGLEREAEAVIDRVIGAVDDRERRLLLEADLCTLAAVTGDTAARARLRQRLVRVASRLAGSTPAERLLLGLRAHAPGLENSVTELTGVVSAALGDGLLLAEQGPESPVFLFMVGALQSADQLEQADRELAAAVVESRRRGAGVGFAMASGLLGISAHKRGRLLAAEADARAAVEVACEMGWLALFPYPLAWLIGVLNDRGEFSEAERLLEADNLADTLPDGEAFTELLGARGALRLAQGQRERARADLLEFGDRLAREADPRPHNWVRLARSLAPVLAEDGREREAQELAEEAVRVAVAFGQPRFIGTALRARARAHAVGPDLVDLQRAVEAFEQIEAPIELAQTLVDVGAVLRRARQPAAAREPLRRALDIARACGARPLAVRAEHELRAAGARPRRDRVTGRDALTASEHRIAQLAIEGMTNRQIAQALFITRKTVETHLERAFRKLGIHSRAELERALAEEETFAPVV